MLERGVGLSATLDELCRTPRLAVVGQIDSATVERFDDVVRAAVRRCPRLIVDLTEVQFLSSLGIGTLFVQADHIVAVAVAPGGELAR